MPLQLFPSRTVKEGREHLEACSTFFTSFLSSHRLIRLPKTGPSPAARSDKEQQRELVLVFGWLVGFFILFFFLRYKKQLFLSISIRNTECDKKDIYCAGKQVNLLICLKNWRLNKTKTILGIGTFTPSSLGYKPNRSVSHIIYFFLEHHRNTLLIIFKL